MRFHRNRSHVIDLIFPSGCILCIRCLLAAGYADPSPYTFTLDRPSRQKPITAPDTLLSYVEEKIRS